MGSRHYVQFCCILLKVRIAKKLIVMCKVTGRSYFAGPLETVYKFNELGNLKSATFYPTKNSAFYVSLLKC